MRSHTSDKMKDPTYSLEIIHASKPVDMGLRAFSFKIPTVVTSIEPNSKEMQVSLHFALCVACHQLNDQNTLQ